MSLNESDYTEYRSSIMATDARACLRGSPYCEVTKSRPQIWLDNIFLFPITSLQIGSLSPQISARPVPKTEFKSWLNNILCMDSIGFTTADFAVHSRNDDIASTISVLAQKLKSRTCSKKVFTKESFSIRFTTRGSRFFRQTENISLLATKCNLSGYCHTGNSAGYYLGNTNQAFNSWPTFSGSYEGLSKLLQVLDCLAKVDRLGPIYTERFSE